MGRPGAAIQGHIVTSNPGPRGFCLPKTAVNLILCHPWAIVPFETTNDEIEFPAAREHAQGRDRCSGWSERSHVKAATRARP